MRLGVFMPNWVGDVVMATPALRALRMQVGEAGAANTGASGALVGVMRPYVAEVLAGSDWFDQTITYAKGASVTAELRTARLDAVVLLTNSLRTAWMAYRSGARVRVGIARDFRSLLLTTRLYQPRRRGYRGETLPTVASYLQIAQAVGAPPVAPTLELATTAADERLADAVWRRFGWDRSQRVAVFNTGGAFGAAKDWPGEKFAELARRLAVERGWRVLVNCGPKERDAARAIVAAANDARVASLADEPDLPMGLTKAVIRRAGLLVSTDSGPRFFGVAFGVPTVTLFGPTSTELTRSFSPHETSVSLGLPCQPCMQRACPLKHHQCMRDLTVDRVYAAAIAAVDRVPRQAAA
jgi:heptosyltransferase-2